MNNTDTNLIEALTLARLPADERFDMKTITKIHNGIKPYYKLLTNYNLPDDVIIVGYGDLIITDGFGVGDFFDCNGCVDFSCRGGTPPYLFYTRTSTAIEKGWWREPIKWRTKTPKLSEYPYGRIAVPCSKEINSYGWVRTWLSNILRCNGRRLVVSQPWQTTENASKMTPEELADIPAEFRWEGK
jgi:hypothetical protein